MRIKGFLQTGKRTEETSSFLDRLSGVQIDSILRIEKCFLEISFFFYLLVGFLDFQEFVLGSF